MLNTDEPIFPRRLDKGPLGRDPACLVPPRTVIRGRHVTLEPLDPARHTAELRAATHGSPEAEAVWTWLGVGPFASEAAFRGEIVARATAFDPVFYALRSTASGRAEGMASFMEIVPRAGTIEIGHLCFGPAIQRTIVTTEALSLMMRLCLDGRETGGLGYRRLQWKCHAFNAPSRRAATRLGFRHEGILFHATTHKGGNRDTAYYSILDHEWPAIRAAHDAWLDPANFDVAGHAGTSLSALTAEIARTDAARTRGGGGGAG